MFFHDPYSLGLCMVFLFLVNPDVMMWESLKNLQPNPKNGSSCHRYPKLDPSPVRWCPQSGDGHGVISLIIIYYRSLRSPLDRHISWRNRAATAPSDETLHWCPVDGLHNAPSAQEDCPHHAPTADATKDSGARSC